VYAANRLLELPQSLIAISIGTALLPTLSQLNSEGKTSQMIQASHDHLKMLLFLSLPSSVGLFLLSQPIVSVLFERGKWGAGETLLVAGMVKIIALMLIFAGFNRVVIPGFYAIKNTTLPAVLTTITVAFHIFLAPKLMHAMGINGLIWSITASGFLGLCLSLFFYRRLIGALGIPSLVLYCLKYLPGLALMAAISVYGFEFIWSMLDILLARRLAMIGALFLTIILSALAYFIMGHILNLPEATAVTRRFSKLVRRSS
jgi:putative peptidoglycan lipid II flippase